MRRLRVTCLCSLVGAALITFAGCERAEGARPVELAVTIQVDESLAFHPDRIECAPGQAIRLRITNRIGEGGPDLPHNLVLLQPGTDVHGFAEAAIRADAADLYIPRNYTSAVLFASALVRPRRQGEFTLQAPAEAGDYPFVCSFPGHCLMGMTGQLVVR